MLRPMWLYQNLREIVRKVSDYKKSGNGQMFGWRKLLDEKDMDYIYYPFVLPLNKNKH